MGNLSLRIIILLFLTSIFVGKNAFAVEAALPDSGQVLKILQLAESYFQENKNDSAALLYNKGQELATAINFKKGMAAAYRGKINVLNRKGRYTDALLLALEAVKVCKKVGDKELASAYNNLGNVYQYLGDLNSAALQYLNALRISEAMEDKSLQQLYNNNLASVFLELEEKEKSFQYANRAYQLARQNNDTLGIASCLVNLGVSEILNKNYNNAFSHLSQVLDLGIKINDLSYVLDAYINLGDLEAAKKDYKSALLHYQQALQTLKSYPVPDYELYVNWGLAQNYFHLALFDEANHYLQESIRIGQSINALKELRKIYLLGSEINENIRNPVLALDYRKKYEDLNDSLLNFETQQSIHKLETEYRTSLKEKAIAQQKFIIANNKLEIEKKNYQILISTAISIGLLLSFIIIILFYQNKQRTNSEKLLSIQKENEIKILMAKVEGEEEERTRLARELHDGVGGILSATKMHLSILKSETAIFVDQSKFEHTISMVDHAAQEIRTIAHNLSPAVFLNYNLSGALSAFCKSVSNANLQVEFYFLGEAPTYIHNFRLIIYRIVQELINNIIKHSHATHALVQLSQHEDVLSITVEDNGIGFVQSQSNGIGLANLQQRVKDLNGQITINSEPGNGTTIYLEFDTSSFVVFTVGEPSSLKI